MLRNLRLMSVLLMLGFCTGAYGDLISYHPFDEGAGTEAGDVTGNANDGVLTGGVEWVDGYKGSGVRFDTAGERIVIGPIDPTAANDAMTLAAWINWEGMGSTITQQGIIGKRQGWDPGTGIKWFWQAQPSGALLFRADWANGGGAGLWWGNTYLVPHVNEWAHVALTWDNGAAVQYINGEEVSSGNITFQGTADATPVSIGCVSATNNETFVGTIDEARIYDTALTAQEITQAMIPGAATGSSGPVPSGGATDVRRDPLLSWTPGEFAASHDVYFGMAFADVNEATRTDDRGVMLSRSQAGTSYDLGRKLQLNTTYYWRVDEVNAPPDTTIFKGPVWDFTVEPLSYPLTAAITATASSEFGASASAMNTVNGSGLNATGGHGTASDTMWLTSPTDPGPWWIQFALDTAYALHEMQVWNQNQSVETLIGFGAKDITIETSLDGEAWTVLEGVTALNRAPGLPNYQANSTVAFNSVLAQYVRITIHNNQGGAFPQTGLGEVRFSYIPMVAREPVPANGVTVGDTDVTLAWRSGREAARHELLFSTNEQAVTDGSAVIATVDATRHALGTLDLGSSYFWRVNEVNDAGANPRYDGSVWSFSTPESRMIDDMEMYSDEELLEIWSFWVDGFEDNGNGSIVGNGNVGETSIVYQGRQSMPLHYDNTTVAKSEATRTFDPALDLRTGNPDTLSVRVNGLAPDYLENADGTVTVGAAGADIWATADEFRFVYKNLNGNGSIKARLHSQSVVHDWSKAGVMIRETLAPEAANALVANTGVNGVRFQARPGSFLASVNDDLALDAVQQSIARDTPVWLRIERVGNNLNGYYALDEAGNDWVAMGWNPQSIPMVPNVLIGLAVTSHSPGNTVAAQFSNVTTTGNVTGAWTAEAIGVEQPSNTPDRIYMVLTDGSGKQQSIMHPNPDATVISTWEAWTVSFDDLTVNTGSIKSITLGVGSPGGAASGATGTAFFDNLEVLKPYAP